MEELGTNTPVKIHTHAYTRACHNTKPTGETHEHTSHIHRIKQRVLLALDTSHVIKKRVDLPVSHTHTRTDRDKRNMPEAVVKSSKNKIRHARPHFSAVTLSHTRVNACTRACLLSKQVLQSAAQCSTMGWSSITAYVLLLRNWEHRAEVL